MAAILRTEDPGNGASPRSAPLILIAVFVTIFVLKWAQPVFIPLFLALIVSYALGPAVDWFERGRIPRWLSSAVLMVGIVVGVGAAAWSMRDEAGGLSIHFLTPSRSSRSLRARSSKVRAGRSSGCRRLRRKSSA